MEDEQFDVEKFLENSQLVLDWPKDPKDIIRRKKRLSELGGQPLGIYDRSLKRTVFGRIESNGHNDCSYSFRESSGEGYPLLYANLERLYVELIISHLIL